MKRAAGYLLAWLCLSVPAPAPAASLPSAAARLPPTYRAIRSELRTSSVPVLLPAALPPGVGRMRSVSVISAGSAGYYVGFSPLVHCAGAVSCAFLHVAGFPRSGPADHAPSRDRSVRLPDGTRGRFRPKDCSGANCTEASLTFERGGAWYELDAKLARDELATLERVYADLRVVR